MGNDTIVTLDYGSGGKKTSSLINNYILPVLGNTALDRLGDGAVVENTAADAPRLVISTDSFVVSPYIFPGGDIGKLAVCGTVNDVSMAGGEIKYLTLSMIIEEGFPFSALEEIIASIKKTADAAGVEVVTGDTKVVEKGRGDGIYLNTTGAGFLRTPGLGTERFRDGDAVIVSGNIGDHGTAVMLARNPNLVNASVVSDCAPLKDEALALGKALGSSLKIMRDPTRGGLATTLNEFIEPGRDGVSRFGIELKETDIPVSDAVKSACGMLGLDPLYSACEGRLIAVTDGSAADDAVAVLKGFPDCADAAVIGHVTSSHPGKLVIRTPYGTGRIAGKLSGSQLPRIC